MLALILKLLAEATNLTPILVTLIQQLKNQGTDVDAIIKASADRFTANELREIEHLASLPPKV